MRNLTKKINREFDLYIFDMDGVIYSGSKVIDGAKETLDFLKRKQKKIAFFTNNSTSTPLNFVKKMKEMGISVEEDQIVTSSTVSADYLKTKYFGSNNKVFIIGEFGLEEILRNEGFSILNNKYTFDEIITSNIKTDFVIAGLDRNFTYKKLAAATQLIARGASFYATNNDATLPDIHGLLPGAGSTLSAIITATGKNPEIIFGKPSPEGAYNILNRFHINTKKTIMIGDRPDTDIMCAKNAGITSALVLTGVISESQIINIASDILPDYILKDTRGLIYD